MLSNRRNYFFFFSFPYVLNESEKKRCEIVHWFYPADYHVQREKVWRNLSAENPIRFSHYFNVKNPFSTFSFAWAASKWVWETDLHKQESSSNWITPKSSVCHWVCLTFTRDFFYLVPPLEEVLNQLIILLEPFIKCVNRILSLLKIRQTFTANRNGWKQAQTKFTTKI